MNDLINQVIGHYKITEEIALGGMGSVYKAINQKLNRTVAIKVINPNLISNPSLINRFYKEAKIQAKMSHINIVTVYDYFEHQNNHFLVMEYLDGESVDKIIKEQVPFDIVTALSMFKQMLSGLSHAHSKGVIHKDIKTSNFILTPTVIQITDFGISQLITESSDDTSNMGTLDYMSPEQFLGNQIDYRTDIYSISIAFYEILCARSPYGIEYSSYHEIKKAHLEMDPISITTYNKNFPSQLDQIIHKGLSKNPKTRHQSATDYLIAIDKFIEANKSKKIKTMELSEGKHTTSVNLSSVNFTFKGEIQNTPFHKLLIDLFNKKQTGFLYIESDIKLQIYFQNGYIANVSGVIEDLTLGEMLVRSTKITKEDQKQAVNFSLETGLKIEEVLITMNKISSHDLSSLLEDQIKHKLNRGFRLIKGNFAFKSLDQLRLNIAYNINPIQVIYDHVVTTEYSNLDEDLWNQRLNSTYMVSSDIEEKLNGIVFSNSKEVRIIDTIKKTNKLIDPAKDIPLEKESKFNLLHFLIISELIETVESKGTTDPALQENGQTTDNTNIKDQSSAKNKKVKYKITRKLSIGKTMSYKEELDLPADISDQKVTIDEEVSSTEEISDTIVDLVDEEEEDTQIMSPEENKELIKKIKKD